MMWIRKTSFAYTEHKLKLLVCNKNESYELIKVKIICIFEFARPPGLKIFYEYWVKMLFIIYVC